MNEKTGGPKEAGHFGMPPVPRRWVVFAALAATAGASAVFGWRTSGRTAPAADDPEAMYACAMHPEVRMRNPGACGICGMRLTLVAAPASPTGPLTTSLTDDAVAVVGVRTAAAVVAPVRRHLRVSGTIEDNPNARYRVTAATAGRVESLHVRQTGETIHAGRPLVDIYSPMLLTAVRRQVALRRLAARPAPEGTPSLTLEQQRMLEGGDQQLLLMGLTQAQCDALGQGPENPTRLPLLAPVSGTLAAIHVQAGSSFREGDALFDIANLASRAFVFEVPDDDLALLSAQQEVSVRVPSLPGAAYRAQLGRLPLEVDPTTRLAKMRVPVEAIRPGPRQGAAERPRVPINRAFALGDIEVLTEPVLTVPRSAVLATGEIPRVYVEAPAPGRYMAREVSLGRSGDAVWEITAGLTAGERVVTAGAMLVDAQRQMQAHAAHAGNSDRSP